MFVSPMLPAHVLQVVVEVHGASTQIAPQQRGMGGEDGCHRQAPGTAQTQTNACQPLVEVGNHIWLLFVLRQELRSNGDRVTVLPRVTEGNPRPPACADVKTAGSIHTDKALNQRTSVPEADGNLVVCLPVDKSWQS